MKVPEICAYVEMNRTLEKLGFGPKEIREGDLAELKNQTLVYKVLFDWIRSNNYRLSENQQNEIEEALRIKLTDYKQITFDTSE